MATLSYWEKRMEQLYNAQDKKNNALDKKLRKEYHRLEESIKKDIASYYQKYGTDNVIQYRQLVLSLSQSERDLLYKDMETFAKRYPQYAGLMPIRESIYKLNRLEGLQLSIRMKMVELGAFEQEGFEKLLMKAYERGYLSTMKGLDNAPSFFSVNDIFLQQTLNQKWIDGGNFSSRIWTNKEKLINTLNSEIRDAIIRGDDYKQMSKIIQNRLGVGANDAYRLVVTESAFVMNQANKQAFMDAGIERYEITAVLDHRTSPICKHLNGQQFNFKDAKVGVNYPPFHPFCRTTVVPIENGTVMLTEDEERAINQYISSDSYKINEKLRNNLPLDDNDRTLIKNLDRALDKLPKYEGDLNRSLTFTSKERMKSFLNLFVLNEVINFSEYISTSKDIYDEDDHVRLIIKNTKNGVDLKGFNDNEVEVLYKRDSSFITVDGWIEEDGKIIIVLEEYNE